MRNIVAWIVALSVVVMLGGAALAGGDGACSYATAAPDKTEAEKLLLMQGDKVAKTVATPKK
jgi:heme A synthase